MNRPQSTYWLPIGLTLLTSSLASAAHAAMLGNSPETATEEEIRTAQILPDTTLEAEASVVTPDVSIQGDLADQIEGGAVRGENLFHSFQDFNVNTGQRVYFAHPSGIENILSRVTGGNLSNIDGLLGVNGAANLFLLNPNGIVFGPNAELDIRGSFLASTGDSFAFADGSEFSAVNPQAGAVLSVSVPLGVQFNHQPQNDITNDGNLAVGAGQSLTLFGDTVLSSGSLTASGGAVEVLGNRVGLIQQAQVDVSSATAGGEVLIGGDYQGQGESPTADRTFVASGVTINADALVEGDGGRVIVWADDLTGFYGRISAQGGIRAGDGGFVEVSGLGNLDFAGEVNTQALNGQSGSLLLDPANITIADTAPPGFTTVGGMVLADFFYGEAEDVGQNSHITPTTVEDLLDLNSLTLEATDTIAVNDDVEANSGNDLTLRASFIQVNNSRLSQSGGGDIVLETPQTVGSLVLVDGGEVNTDVLVGTALEGSDVRIITHDLIIVNNGIVSANTFGQGDSGLLSIEATGEVVVDGDGSFIGSQVGSDAVGTSGGVNFFVNNLAVLNGANIGASTFGLGNSGRVRIEATGEVVLDGDGSFIGSQVGSDAVGDSGGVDIVVGNLLIRNGAGMGSDTFGWGNSGRVRIEATGEVVVDGDGTFIGSQVLPGAVGNSGGVDIVVNNLAVLNDADMGASTFGQGNSGQVRIRALGDVVVDGDGSFIGSQVLPGAVGNSGGVDIVVDDLSDLSVLNGAGMGASTFGRGNSGQVRIEAGDIFVDGEDSFIGSQVNSGAEGDSGGVDIVTNNLSIFNGAGMSSSIFGQGNSGQVRIQADDDIVVEGKGSFIGSQVGPDAVGDSGGVEMNTNNLSILNGARLTTSTSGRSSAGSIELQSNNDANLNISLTAESRIEASTESQGRGGTLTVRTAGVLTIQGAGKLTVESLGSSTGAAGDLNVFANSVLLDDGVELSAQTASDQGGGNINFAVSDAIIMRRGSFINAQSTNETSGSGGNININAGFIVTVPDEDSDIIANAVGGAGGRINITTNQLLGFTEQSGLDFDQLRGNTSSDISASSEFGQQGEITINNLAPDLNQGLVELPTLTPTPPIQRGCSAEAVGDSRFTVSGRGGIPPSPTDILNRDLLLDDLGPETSNPVSPVAVNPPEPATDATAPIVEAQGMVKGPDGRIFFVAQMPGEAGQGGWGQAVQCSGRVL